MTASTGKVPGRIFMSYRRGETEAYKVYVGWLYDRLASHFGREQVFKDVDSIRLGHDFVEAITTAVESCDVLLALIGQRWLTITDEYGRRRLDVPGDFVRLEIVAALKRNVLVIPILVEGARMPQAADLPASLTDLAVRQALELSPDRFDAEFGRLLKAMNQTIAEAQEQARQEADRAARHREKVEQLQGQIRERAAAQDWDAVVKVNDELAALDPGAADPDGLASAARAQITRRRQVEPVTAATPQPAGDPPTQPGQLPRGTAGAQRLTAADVDRALRRLADRTQAQPWPVPEVSRLHTPNVEKDVLAVAFSPDGTRLATVSRTAQNAVSLAEWDASAPLDPVSIGEVKSWDIRTGAAVRKLRVIVGGSSPRVNAVALSPDGTRLATGGQGTTAQIWDAASGNEQLTIKHGHRVTAAGHDVRAVAFSPDGTRLATGGTNKTAQIWDATTGRPQLRIRPVGAVMSVAFSPDGTRLATGSGMQSGRWPSGEGGTAQIWDATTGQQQLQVTHGGYVLVVAFSPDGTRLVTASRDRTARIWDATSGQQQLQVAHSGKAGAMAFSPDGTRLATVSEGGTARIWDATSGQQQLQVTRSGAVAVAFSPDGTRLAVAGDDQSVRIWNIAGR